LRNEIIHSGIARRTYARQCALYETTHDLIREYLLRLLKYKGRYFRFRNNGMEPAILR
jgi:hypothetical protein